MSSRLEVRGNVYTQAGPIAITHHAGDSVVAATQTWTFGNANFNSAYLGAIITVSGASNAGNNGAFVISSVISTTSITTSIPTGGLTNETFTAATASVAINPCWDIGEAITQIQLTFADGTILQANSGAAVQLLTDIQGLIKQAEMRGMMTGGPFQWTFSHFGTAVSQVLCSGY